MKNRVLIIAASLFAGLILGWLFFHRSPSTKPGTEKVVKHEEDNHETIWTCSMHPQIRMAQKGVCPICGMDLIPLVIDNTGSDTLAVRFSKDAAELANIETSKVTRSNAQKEIRLYGKVTADERLLQSQTAHFPGRIEKLLVNFNGEKVRYGQTLALIYSPELVTAQQELIEAAALKKTQPEIYQAAKEKLRLWKLSEDQIASIETENKVKSNLEVPSTTNGVVSAVRVKEGDHVSEGTVLYDIADLSRLWILFDAYENDIAFLSTGNRISFTLQAVPGKTFEGKIAYIDPVIDPVTRVARIRIEMKNESGLLKPGMFATGIVSAGLSQYSSRIIIPKSSVLWTGKRSVVYVRQPGEEPVFLLREVELGPLLGDKYIVTEGLAEGEDIVTNGTFSVDAAAQLAGKPSMMNSEK